MTSACIIGIGGYSGSGKTTLIERVLAELKKERLSVGVMKHTPHHRLVLDKEGKDTDRFYRAGADMVCAYDTNQAFLRYPKKDACIDDIIDHFPPGLDLVLVEGYKGSAIGKVWIEEKKSGDLHIPDGKGPRLLLYRDDPGYFEKLLAYIHGELNRCHANRPVMAGLLIGGRSLRMGKTKTLLEVGGQTLVERSFGILQKVAGRVVLLGSSDLPESLRSADRLPDADGVEGPLSGIISALRWGPGSTWIIAAVDMPMMNEEAFRWLMGKRNPGVWAVLPRKDSDGPAETTGACYEPAALEYLESLARRGVARLQALAGHPRVITPEIPEPLQSAWHNINTPRDWQEIRGKIGIVHPAK